MYALHYVIKYRQEKIHIALLNIKRIIVNEEIALKIDGIGPRH